MLTHLHIRNFAIVKHIEIELREGMTVLTGETGAGKSILLDALGLVLGDRADIGQVRDGTDKADISASFSIDDNPAAADWLVENELDTGECLLRRTISRDGRSRGYINGQVAPLQSLRALGERLVDIHGQHEHQLLNRKATQRALLDDYAGNGELLKDLGATYRELQAVNRNLDELEDGGDVAGQLDMLQYQADELEQLDLDPAYIRSLDDEFKRLSNAGKLLADCRATLDSLYENDNAVHGRIARMQQTIGSLLELDQTLAPIAQTLEEAAILCNEAAIDLRDYLARIDLDDRALADLEQTLETLYTLSRKHRTRPELLGETFKKLLASLDSLANAGRNREELESQQARITDRYLAIDADLGTARRLAADKLGAEISEHMQQLGMAGGHFTVAIESPQSAKPGPHGSHDIIFMVSANPGLAARPLTKVASGGELSRISLALQLVASRYKSAATLVFDEVDSGIGGAVAETVGRQLRKLSDRTQVMCVTHLAQVASQGKWHFVVDKRSDEKVTAVRIRALNAEQKVEEVARMLGGISITEQSRSHAQEMLTSAG